MKNLKYNFIIILSLTLTFFSCQEDNFEVGNLKAPSNIEIQVDKVGADSNNPNGDGSGTVNFKATADNVTAIHFVIQNQTKLAKAGSVSHDFTVLGLNSYAVTVIAFGTGGSSSSKTIEVDVLSLYEPPADLLQMLYGGGTRVWRIKNEGAKHFGLGPVGGNPFEYYGANPNDKATVGMYDDRYIFNQNGTFTHIVDNTNDDPTTDTSGTVFGRENLINELGGAGGGTTDGADILNYGYSDYSVNWALSAPGSVETISLTGIGFIGYYVGGNHKYKILSRSANEMVLSTTDGNNQFEWGFTLVAE